MLLDKIEHLEVPFRVAQHRVELLQLEQADVTVMILQGLLLEPSAILRREPETLFIPAPFRLKSLHLRLVIIQEGFAPVGMLAVGAALGVHLQHPQVHAKLNFLHTVPGLKSPDHKLAGLVIPLVQNRRNVEAHAGNMNSPALQVNADDEFPAAWGARKNSSRPW